MAYVTPIGSNPEQIEYRLTGAHGCKRGAAEDVQFSYHADGQERPLVWTGRGLVEVGIVPGTVLDESQFDTARALMAGLDPRTGERLVTAKLAVYDDAKVDLGPLVAAVNARAAERGVAAEDLFPGGKVRTAWTRAVRMVGRDGEAARLRADEAGQLADTAGVSVDSVWGTKVYGTAVANLTRTETTTVDGRGVEQEVPRRRVVGNRGYDVSFTLPKSYSLLLAFADEATAVAIEDIYTRQVSSTFDWLEQQTAYGMRGKHGEGRCAEVVRGTGFLGWSMVHRAARPVGDRVVGDPHWHVHVTIANMTRGQDGKWSTVAAGGRDLMRHAAAVDHALKALTRYQLIQRYGVEFTRSRRTGAWEVAAVSDDMLRNFSKRGLSIEAVLRDLGFDPQQVTRRVEALAAAQTRAGKTHATTAPDATLRETWQREARELGIDPDELAAAAMRGPDSAPRTTVHQDPFEVVMARLLDPEDGLTANARRFSRVDALAAVADALPGGARDLAAIEAMTDRALAAMQIVALPGVVNPAVIGPNGARRQLGAAHMANADRYTTADVVTAETIILAAAAESRDGQGMAHVDPETVAMARSVVEAGQGFELSEEQVDTLVELVTSDRAVDAVIGPPGTGKTTLMRAARAAWESGGYVVAGAATAAVAAQNLHLESGIEARTVAQWIHAIGTRDVTDPAGAGGLAGVDVLVLDEANLTDDRDRAVLYTEAARCGTKIVEVGDPKQLRGVGCGSLFGKVHDLVDGPQLRHNRRQRDEDERLAIAAWRDGRYSHALYSWTDRGRVCATETADQAITAMVSTWMLERRGAPDPHQEIRGVVMLAAHNETVDRLNEVAQAVRAASGELGADRTYRLAAGRDLHLYEGDHVLIRLNDRQQRAHIGPDVLNGYRGVVERIDPDSGGVQVAWQQSTEDGQDTKRAVLEPRFVAAGGLSLGYAMTTHKAEGLTVSADWQRPDGTRNGGVVLVYGPGMDQPGLHVATSRHRDRMYLFASREQLESAEFDYEHGRPRTDEQRTARVVDAMAEEARKTETTANDRPVLEDLGQVPEPTVQRRVGDTVRRLAAQEAERARERGEDTEPTPEARPRREKPAPPERREREDQDERRRQRERQRGPKQRGPRM